MLRPICGLFAGAIYGVLHGLAVVSLAAIVWYFGEELVVAGKVIGSWVALLAGAVWLFIVWLMPYIGQIAGWLWHVLVALAGLAYRIVVRIAGALIAAIVALWIMIFPPQPLPAPPVPAEPTRPPIAILDTSGGIRFFLVTSACKWIGKSATDIDCGTSPATQQPRPIDEVLREARSILNEAPRILIMGIASCDGVRKANEDLAVARAREMRERLRRGGLDKKPIIIMSLGQSREAD